MNKLYIIEGIFCDFTCGMAVICAPSLDRCREIFAEKFSWGLEEFDYSIKAGNYKVFEGVNHVEGIVSYSCGGS